MARNYPERTKRSQTENYPCGHPRTEENSTPARPGVMRCRTCKRAATAARREKARLTRLSGHCADCGKPCERKGTRCRDCYEKEILRKNKRQAEAQELFCIYRQHWLPRRYFANDKSRASGKSNICRECDHDKFQRWYAINKERVIQKVMERRRKKLVVEVAGEQHNLNNTIEGKSPLRVFYELTTREEEAGE